MFKNHNEKKLLRLMLNKEGFMQYVIQQYNDNDCCTPLEPLIWAVHFNIPKYQRLPLLEHIIHQSLSYIRTCYNFLPEKQILGKTYEVLGIPTVCGEPDKRFLNAYKKYKSYYPVKYLSNEKTSVLSNHIHDSNKKKNSPKHSIRRHCTSHTTNQRVISSTPIRREFNGSLPFFESYLSPITTSMKYEQQILSTSLFYDEDYDFDVKNVKQNSAYHDNVQTSLLQNTSYLSGFSILNTSQQIFNTEQDIDVTNTKKKNNEHSQMRFIRSKKPKYIQTENSISQLDIDTNVTTEKSLREKSQDNKDMIVYFDHKYESIHEESKTNNSSTSVLKQSLGKEIYKNISYEYLNDSEMSMPHSSTDKNMSKLKKNRSKTKKSISELNISKSWKMIKQTFSDILFSDLDKTVEVVITKKNSLCTNKFHTKIKQDSVKSSQNNISQRYNINYESMDIKSQNNEEENIFSANSFLKMSNQSNYNAKIRFNKPNESSFIFSEDSIFMPNLKNNSDQLNLIKHDRMNGSQDSSSNYENKSINHNRIAGLLNNIKFEDISHIEMDESISVSLPSDIEIL